MLRCMFFLETIAEAKFTFITFLARALTVVSEPGG